MSTIEKSIDVEVPVRTAYDQWTQFESFPRFMEGVEEVKQLDDKRLHWKAEIAGVVREWDAEIVDQTPDQQITWRSLDGTRTRARSSSGRPMPAPGSPSGWTSTLKASWRRPVTCCTSSRAGPRATSSGSRSSSSCAAPRRVAGVAR